MPEIIRTQTDVLIIGGGIAGAFAAMKARELGAEVLIAEKTFFGRGGCAALASGVWSVYMPGDDPELWVKGFGGINPLVNKKLLLKALPITHRHVMEMERWGVKWVKNGGNIARVSGPGAAIPYNAMMAEGGPQMMMAVRSETLRRGVKLINRLMVQDLLTADGLHPTRDQVIGAIGFDTRSGQIHLINAKATIMATGPYKFPYAKMRPGLHHVGHMPMNLSGDGIAATLRAGANMGKLELGGGSITPEESFNAPGLEMLFGLGGNSIFVNAGGERFLADQDIRKEMFGRSSVTMALWKEILSGRGPVFVDITHFSDEQRQLLRHVIPIVMSNYESNGYNLATDRVPYISGLAASNGVTGAGVRLSEQMATSLPGLYGAGNCSDGAYIAMGQTLAWCAVLGEWAGEQAAVEAQGKPEPQIDWGQVERLKERLLAPLLAAGDQGFEVLHERTANVHRELGVTLSGERLERTIAQVSKVRQELPGVRAHDPRQLSKVLGLGNYLQVFDLILRVLLHRTESRGNVIREDYPQTDNENWLRYTVARLGEEGEIHLWDEPVSLAPGEPVNRTKVLHPFFRA